MKVRAHNVPISRAQWTRGLPLMMALLWTAAAPAQAQPMFVIDRVVLNVYENPNTAGGKIATLQTGDAVETLDTVEDFVRVRMATGQEGWIRTGFLSVQAPAAVRIKQFEGAPLAAELNRQRAENYALQEQIKVLTQMTMNQLAAGVAAAAAQNVLLGSSVHSQPTVAANAPGWSWWVWPAGIGTCLLLGFLLGYQTLARRIRRRYGRLKIY
jgi:SH3-like domain-containing protein